VSEVPLYVLIGRARSCRRVLRDLALSHSGRLIRERQRALRGARPHTVGYVGRCDEEQGEMECPRDLALPDSGRPIISIPNVDGFTLQGYVTHKIQPPTPRATIGP
jgi:hypothetical protein